tara:strand:+ start:103 stop:567 length:465 start_codon:yes stop_codon:yes gene_type:complete
MQKYSLTNQEAAKQGFTHMFNVTEADFTATTGANESINLCVLKAGDFVDNVCVEIVTPFDHANAGTALDLGATGSTDGLIDGGDIEQAAGSIVLLGSGSSASGAPVGVNSDGNLIAKVILTTTTGAVNLTAGSMNIWCRINRAADRKDPAVDNG